MPAIFDEYVTPWKNQMNITNPKIKVSISVALNTGISQSKLSDP